MHKYRAISGLLLIIALLLPVFEKVAHELDHFSAAQCDAQGTHYCEQPHHCDICDQLAAPAFSVAGPCETRRYIHCCDADPVPVPSPERALQGLWPSHLLRAPPEWSYSG